MKILTILESVGCVIDECGVTYPQYPDNADGTFGGYDKDGGFHVDDIENEEWFESLSKKDSKIVNSIIQKRS